jgi:hypothetical protein
MFSNLSCQPTSCSRLLILSTPQLSCLERWDKCLFPGLLYVSCPMCGSSVLVTVLSLVVWVAYLLLVLLFIIHKRKRTKLLVCLLARLHAGDGRRASHMLSKYSVTEPYPQRAIFFRPKSHHYSLTTKTGFGINFLRA